MPGVMVKLESDESAVIRIEDDDGNGVQAPLTREQLFDLMTSILVLMRNGGAFMAPPPPPPPLVVPQTRIIRG